VVTLPTRLTGRVQLRGRGTFTVRDANGDVAETGVRLYPHDVIRASVLGGGHVVGQVVIARTARQFNVHAISDEDIHVPTQCECFHDHKGGKRPCVGQIHRDVTQYRDGYEFVLDIPAKCAPNPGGASHLRRSVPCLATIDDFEVSSCLLCLEDRLTCRKHPAVWGSGGA
jgi:hypothetical protein